MSQILNLTDLNLDWQLAFRRFRVDVRDDFFPDPIDYEDLRKSPTQTVDFLQSLAAQ